MISRVSLESRSPYSTDYLFLLIVLRLLVSIALSFDHLSVLSRCSNRSFSARLPPPFRSLSTSSCSSLSRSLILSLTASPCSSLYGSPISSLFLSQHFSFNIPTLGVFMSWFSTVVRSFIQSDSPVLILTTKIPCSNEIDHHLLECGVRMRVRSLERGLRVRNGFAATSATQ